MTLYIMFLLDLILLLLVLKLLMKDVRKFIMALHPKWRAKVTAIKESKDLTALSLDELIDNLKVHEMIINKDSKIVKGIGEKMRSLTLKAKKNLVMERVRHVKTKNMPWRLDTSKSSSKEEIDSHQETRTKWLYRGSWSDSGEEDEETNKDATCLMAQASNEVLSESSYFSDDNSSIDNDTLDNVAAMSVVYVLTTPIPEDGENAIVDQIKMRNKWDNDDYVCRGLNTSKVMSDLLFDIYPKGFNIVNDVGKSAFMSTFKLNESIIWHARMGHVHFKRMQDMSKDGLIPAFDMDTEKCKTYMLTKITKKSFQNVKRETEVLELIHSDLCDFHATPSLENKKYFVIFIDDAFSIPKLLDIGGSVVLEEVTEEVVTQQPELKLRKSKRNTTPKNFGPGFQLYLTEGTRDEVSDQHSYCFNVDDDPKIFDEAIKSHYVAFWKKAINDEMDSGFKQKPGIDYFDTYAPVACMRIIRLLIAISSIHILIIHQMDVKTAFLNGELDEEVYMNQPQGFIMPDNENKEFLSSRFSMKDIGEADVILDIKIKSKSNGIAISQS
ncbi:zinc finger, CCHC-type containing protein [Tanacetum coccineum]